VKTAAAMQNSIEIPRDHPAFAGHFPKFPVLPGAALLDAVLQVLQRERAVDLTQWRIASVKFIDVVRPGDALCLEHLAAGRSGLIRFTVRVADRTVASGSLASATPEGAPQPDAAPSSGGA